MDRLVDGWVGDRWKRDGWKSGWANEWMDRWIVDG